MDYLLKKLEEYNYKYFCKGIYKNGSFFETFDRFNFNAVKVQIKKEYEGKLFVMFVPLVFKEVFTSEYEKIYEFGNGFYLFVEYVINSHVIVPELLLKDFCSQDTRLYYIDTKNDQIKRGSAKKFNTSFGYYSLRFEKYLSDNYETKIGNIKKKIEKFVINKEKHIQFVGLFEDIKNFLNMSFFRNPRFVDRVNQESLSSKLMPKGYGSEEVAFFYHKYGTKIMENMSIYLLDNRTQEGLLLSSEIFSNIFIKEDVHGMILPLHPKYGLIIVPTDYYKAQNRIYSDQSYMVIQDLETLHKINQRIYVDCKKIGANVIGTKEDLKVILSLHNK